MRLLFKLLEYVANPFTGILSISTQLKTGELEDIKKRTHDIIGYIILLPITIFSVFDKIIKMKLHLNNLYMKLFSVIL